MLQAHHRRGLHRRPLDQPGACPGRLGMAVTKYSHSEKLAQAEKDARQKKAGL